MRGETVTALLATLDELEAHYGRPARPRLRDPYRMVLYRNCGYPQSERNCELGWAALRDQIGVRPEEILRAGRKRLAAALRSGGIVPELRARRLEEIAARVEEEFGGTLRPLLGRPVKEALRALQSFPTLGAAGAEKILLYNLAAPVAAVPSNCLHVPLRLGIGIEGKSWAAGYKSARAALQAALPGDAPGQLRAYLLLQRHGGELCKANRPACGRCPVRARCRYCAGRGGRTAG